MSVYLLPMQVLFDRLSQLLVDLERDSIKYAESKSDYESVDDQKKPYLALISEQFTEEKSQTAKESKAYADRKWTALMENLSAKRLAYYKAQSQYELTKTKLDVLRTMISARKEEIKKFEG